MSGPREPYITLSYPFNGPAREISKREAREGMRLLMEQKGARIDLIREFLRVEGRLSLDVKSKLSEFDALPQCLVALGGRRTMSSSEFEARISKAQLRIQPFLKTHLPIEDIDDQTSAMCFDAGLLWGECFLDKYPNCTWALGGGGRLSFDFQRPVIVNPCKRGPEFNPQQDLRSMVWHPIVKGERGLAPSEVTESRARQLGLECRQ